MPQILRLFGKIHLTLCADVARNIATRSPAVTLLELAIYGMPNGISETSGSTISY